MRKSGNSRKQIFLLIVIISICLIGTVYLSNTTDKSSIGHGDYPYYSDSEDLVRAADVIIEGSVINVAHDQEINIAKDGEEPLSLLYDVSDIQITKVLQGDLNVGDIIQVKQLVDNGITHKEGTEGIFFLDDYSDFKEGLPYSELNPDQGMVEIVDGKIKTDNKIFKSGEDKDRMIGEIEKMSLAEDQAIGETEETTLSE